MTPASLDWSTTSCGPTHRFFLENSELSFLLFDSSVKNQRKMIELVRLDVLDYEHSTKFVELNSMKVAVHRSYGVILQQVVTFRVHSRVQLPLAQPTDSYLGVQHSANYQIFLVLDIGRNYV